MNKDVGIRFNYINRLGGRYGLVLVVKLHVLCLFSAAKFGKKESANENIHQSPSAKILTIVMQGPWNMLTFDRLNPVSV
jgi:hypothetical protein